MRFLRKGFDNRSRAIALLFSVALLTLSAGPLASAQSSSTNYQINEYNFGSGGELEASSSNYKARQSAGELVVGKAFSTSYQFQGGFNTTDIPLLEVAVDGGTFDLGNIDALSTRSVSTTFSVRNYLASGYTVALRGSPPSTGFGSGHSLTAMNSLAAPDPGTEQFGINLVENSLPDVGANPFQVPDNSFSFGSAVAGYDTPNMFKFVDGEIIALSTKSSGQTVYTMSIIANVSETTAAGEYTGNLNVIVTPTF